MNLRKIALVIFSIVKLDELSKLAVVAIKDALKDSDNKTRLKAAKLLLGMPRMGKGKEKDNSPILELLEEAIKGIEGEMGLKV